MKRIISASIVAFLTCLLVISAQADTTYETICRPQSRFFEGELLLPFVPLMGQQATINLRLTAMEGDYRGATIQFRTPEGVSLLGNSIFTGQYLTRGLPRRYQTAIQVLEEGSYALQATVYFQLPDGQQRAEHFFVYLLVGSAQSRTEAYAFSPLTRRNMRVNTSPSRPIGMRVATDGKVTVSGYITYYDDNLLEELPIKKVMVELLEEDEVGYKVALSTYTDNEGFYSFVGVASGMRTLRLKVSFINDTLKITDGTDGDEIYSFESIINMGDSNFLGDSDRRLDLDLDLDHFSYKGYGDVSHNFFLDSQNQHRGLGHIFNCVVEAADFLQERVGWSRARTKIRWPYGEWPSHTYSYGWTGAIVREYIQIPAGWQWNRTAIFHEWLGHSVMVAMYGYKVGNLPQMGGYVEHYISMVSDPGFALWEGWAQLSTAVVDDNAFNQTAFTTMSGMPPDNVEIESIPNIESNSWRTPSVEGAVAGLLWDIVDTDRSHDGSPGVDDDNMDDLFDDMWDLMITHRPRSILEFVDHWINDGYMQVQDLRDICIEYAIPISFPKGDVNDDGQVSEADVIIVLRFVANLIELTNGQKWAADMDEDGEVSSRDAFLILNMISVERGEPIVFSTPERMFSHSGLWQNYPNPFNPETWIPYQLAEGSEVTIRIYSVAGQLIRSLDLGYREAGLYVDKDEATYWDGRNAFGEKVSSGVYFYSIATIGYNATRKMVILE